MKSIALGILLLGVVYSGIAQEVPIKIVFDVTSSNEKVHQAAIRHAKAMSKAYPNSQFEVVVYSGAIDMVLKGKSSVQDDIESLADNDNVKIVVCQGTMKRYNVDMSQIIDGVGSVEDGILEIVERQQQGWGYIKEAL